MTQLFDPRLDVLPAPQLRLWPELAQVPPEFVLYGGTAIALHLGHRQSIDFDFFGDRDFDSVHLVPSIPFLADAIVTQREPNTLGCTVDRNGEIKLSFFGLPRLRRLEPPLVARDNGLRIAALPDLAATKMSVVQMRAELKDYLDIDAILQDGRIGLPAALAAAGAVYGSQFNPLSTLKALTFFDDGNVRALAADSRARLIAAVAAVDLDKLPPYPDETFRLARRLIWFEEPEIALADPVRLIAYALERATIEDLLVLRRYVSDAQMRAALDAAPPGIIGPRSWAYWNAKYGRYPAPPMPTRRF
eukprot:gene6627-6695_t